MYLAFSPEFVSLFRPFLMGFLLVFHVDRSAVNCSIALRITLDCRVQRLSLLLYVRLVKRTYQNSTDEHVTCSGPWLVGCHMLCDFPIITVPNAFH